MSEVCVIGAGSSGIAACQALHDRGIAVECFEAGSAVGGNWRYGNDNEMSAAYRSLCAKSSRRGMQYAALPMPGRGPRFPGHERIAAYLDRYVDNFGFRDRIRFRTLVIRVRPAAGGGWDVRVRQRDTGAEDTRRYQAVLVANGHHWDPRYPEPAIPGAGTFDGEVLHARDYRTPDRLADRRVLIVGLGNSGADIAAECSQVAARTLVAVRRGVHVVPKRLLGMPTDYLTLIRPAAIAPSSLRRAAVTLAVRTVQRPAAAYGLPRPDHRLLDIPPTVSDTLLSRVAGGHIGIIPGIDHFEADRAVFTDGSAERVDTVIYCTGYKISFPFLDPAALGADGYQIPLYRRVVSPRLPGLYFIGLVQPVGAIMPIAEIQSQWVADLLAGRARLPSVPEMNREIARYHAAAASMPARSGRYTIGVDFPAYMREIGRERRAGAVRPPEIAGRPAGAPVRRCLALRYCAETCARGVDIDRQPTLDGWSGQRARVPG